jgi:hypothetical protein
LQPWPNPGALTKGEPGEVLCHEVEEFGGLWLVVAPSGEAVQ